jgi:hypothetical protein
VRKAFAGQRLACRHVLCKLLIVLILRVKPMLNRLRSLFGIGVLVLAGLLVAPPHGAMASQPGHESAFADKNVSGNDLAAAFLELLTAAGKAAAPNDFVKPYLDPAFILQRASGKRYTADNYIPPLIDGYDISDVRETRPAPDVMVLRYAVRAAETAPDTALVMSTDKAPRLTVFHWSEKASRWQVVSHANFNVPVAAVCDTSPVSQNALASPATPEDYKLGIDTVNEFIKLLEASNTKLILHPMVQVQTASGFGITTLAERKKPSTASDMTYKDPVISRDGKLLVFSAYFLTKQHDFMKDNQLRVGIVPHLLTFMQVEDGSWKMIANALFSPPAEVPKGTSCIVRNDLQNAL